MFFDKTPVEGNIDSSGVRFFEKTMLSILQPYKTQLFISGVTLHRLSPVIPTYTNTHTNVYTYTAYVK